MSTFRPVILLPTYNNAETLHDIVERSAALGHPLIIVNDGSSDETAMWLANLARDDEPPVIVITHEHNRGKAAALQTGFAAAAERQFTHAATMDTDGQLDPEDLPRMLTLARENPHALILGARDDTRPDYPERSRLGRRLSNLAIRLECGARVEDSQCGLRVYPLGLTERIRCRSSRFGFETEILTRAAWAGCTFVTTPVSCRYFSGDDRVTHLNPFRETARALVFHARLIGRALLPWPHRRSWPVEAAEDEVTPPPSRWRRLLGWISPRALWKQVRDDDTGPSHAAMGFGVGVFIANLPIYGFQTVVSLFVARRLHLHPLAVVAGSHVSTPPIGPVLIAAAIGVGHFVLHGDWPSFETLRATPPLTLLGEALLDWIVGGFILGAALGFTAYGLVLAALKPLARRSQTHVNATSADQSSR